MWRTKSNAATRAALRTDTTKYQFQQAGSFTLPERVFLWWDRQQEELQRKTLPGLTIAVAEASVAVSSAREPEPERSPIWMFAAVGLLALGLFAWLIRNPVLRWIEAWRAHHIRPERSRRETCDRRASPMLCRHFHHSIPEPCLQHGSSKCGAAIVIRQAMNLEAAAILSHRVEVHLAVCWRRVKVAVTLGRDDARAGGVPSDLFVSNRSFGDEQP